MTLAAARVTLRQICQLKLPGSLVLPALLPALRQLIKADHAAFFYCDERGNISNLYAERMLPPEVQARFHDHYSEAQFRKKYLERVKAPNPISRHSLTSEELQQPYFTEVLRPLGIAHFLYAIVRSNTRVLGQLSLYRGPHEQAFSSRDETLLNEVIHYLMDALAQPDPSSQSAILIHAVETGMAVFDPKGHVVFSDETWERLIRMAKGDPITPATALYETQSLPRFIKQLLDTMETSPLALHRTETRWGSFAFKRHQLQSVDGKKARGLIVSRLAAEPLRLSEAAAGMDLSPKQREVALLLAQGQSNQAIAQELGISLNTVAYHVKLIFSRLHIHHRDQVKDALTQQK